MVKKGPKIKARASNIKYLTPPLTFHHLNTIDKSVSMSNKHEVKIVTGIYFLKEPLGRKSMVITHKKIAFPILNKFAVTFSPPFYLI